MRTLVVDDSKSMAAYLAGVLGTYGEVQVAHDGRQAVAAFGLALEQARSFDLVILDIIMPEMDGLSALRAMRDLEHNLERDAGAHPGGRPGGREVTRARVVMLSQVAEPEQMLRAQFQDGADMYLTKPFQEAVLHEALHNLGLVSHPHGAEG